MMSVSVLTGSNFDGTLLGTLLAEEQARGAIDVGVVMGMTSSYSVARTILAVDRIPVALVIDANSPEPEAALERKRRAEAVIGDAAGGVPFRVIVAVPELAVLFLERPELLRRVFGEVDEHVMELAQLSRAVRSASSPQASPTIPCASGSSARWMPTTYRPCARRN